MKRTGILGIAVAGAALLVLGVLGIGWMLTRSGDTGAPESAEAAAWRYLHALEEGDYDAVAELLPDRAGASDRAIEDAFRGASGYVTQPRIQEQVPDASGETGFRVAVRLGGQEGTVFFGLAQHDGAWVLASDYLATLEVSTTLGTHVMVGDALVAAGQTSVLPALYPVRAVPEGILSGEVLVAVTNEVPVSTRIEAAVGPDADVRAQAALDAHLAECTAPAASVPAGCGILVPWGADLAAVSGFRYRIDTDPTISIAAAGESFVATGGDLIVTATGTTPEGDTASFTYRDADWTLRGTVGFEADALILTVF